MSETYTHLVDLRCPTCHPDPIETVLRYQTDSEGRIDSIKCDSCGQTAKPEVYEP